MAIQPLLAPAILALGLADPRAAPGLTALAAVAVAFLSASQDIVIDAYRIELLRPEEQGAGAAATQWGYRFGMLAASAGALYAASFAGWRFAYGLMAALMLVGMATVWLTPSRAACGPPEALPGDTALGRVAAWLERAVLAPFRDMLTRRGALTILAFVVLYKFGDALAGTMSNPLYVSLGFTKVEVADIGKVYGFTASLAGLALGGVVVLRLGIMRALLVCGVAADAVEPDVRAAGLGRARRAGAGLDHRGRESDRRDGLGGVRRLPLRLCSIAFTATQYALLSSLAAVGPHDLVGLRRRARRHARLGPVFSAEHAACLPGLALLLWIMRVA